MKALALILVLLVVGDVVFDDSAGVIKLGQASHAFAQSCADSFSGSLFAA
ncbi:hypothetical protein [Sphingomonas bacterium]|nr:hypothetical protein [Sphingomonas bacterium]